MVFYCSLQLLFIKLPAQFRIYNWILNRAGNFTLTHPAVSADGKRGYMQDKAYTHPLVKNASGELAHHYGHHVHLMANPLALTWLARLGNPNCVQPEVNRLTRLLYHRLVEEVVNRELDQLDARIETRMSKHVGDDGFYEGVVINPNTEVTVVDIARAGMLPSMICFEALCEVLDPSQVRQDHIMMNRTTNHQDQVTGSDMSGTKIAGPVCGRTLLFPDPMGATGGSLTEAIRFYQTKLDGCPKRFVCLNLIVTPEFIRRITDEFGGQVVIYAYRLDRGLSTTDVLETVPGTRWSEERGLTDNHYIVPGAGGMGEVMNNALS